MAKGERGTSNTEHRTSNIEARNRSAVTSRFGVRCSMFDVFQNNAHRPPRTFLVIFSVHAIAFRSHCPRSKCSTFPQVGQGKSCGALLAMTTSNTFPQS